MKKMWLAVFTAAVLVGLIAVIGWDKRKNGAKEVIVAENEMVSPDKIVIVERSGGLCPIDRICKEEITIYGNGKMIRSRTGETAAISSEEAERLNNAITKKNIEELKRKKFTGLCPTAYDGMEVSYIFVADDKEERISSCEYDLTDNNPLIVEVAGALAEVGW